MEDGKQIKETLVVDWSGLAHRCWGRVHSSAYRTETFDPFVDAAREVVLTMTLLRARFPDAPIVLAQDSRPYWREEVMARHYAQNCRAYSRKGSDEWLVAWDTSGLMLTWNGEEWKRTHVRAKELPAVEGEPSWVPEPDVRAAAASKVCPQYKRRSWGYTEPQEQFEAFFHQLCMKMALVVGGCCRVLVPTLEADDIAACVVSKAMRRLCFGELERVVLVSDDSDWEQLLQFHGVVKLTGPAGGYIRDGRFQVLTRLYTKVCGGDSTDGIPGVLGKGRLVGPASAAKTIEANGLGEEFLPGYGTPEFLRNRELVCLMAGDGTSTEPRCGADNARIVHEALEATWSGWEPLESERKTCLELCLLTEESLLAAKAAGQALRQQEKDEDVVWMGSIGL